MLAPMTYTGEFPMSESELSDYEASLPDLPEVVESVHYVDNKEMLDAYIKYQEQRKKANEAGLPDPVLPRFLGECILNICRRTAYKHNFINYSFRDEMISDAIENCIRGINTFNPETTSSIFSYYTTAAFNSFRRRIQREATESAIRGKIISELDIDSLVTQEHDNGEFQTDFVEYMKQAHDHRLAYEKKEKDKDKEEKEVEEFPNALVFDGE